MNYEERERQLCNNCEAKENCFYISRNLESKCSFKETTMYGWELGYKDAIDKACEFFNERMWEYTFLSDEVYVVDGESSSKSEFIRNFKDYMEEQQ